MTENDDPRMMLLREYAKRVERAEFAGYRGVAVSQQQADALRASVGWSRPAAADTLSGQIGTVSGYVVHVVADGEPAPDGFKDLRPAP